MDVFKAILSNLIIMIVLNLSIYNIIAQEKAPSVDDTKEKQKEEVINIAKEKLMKIPILDKIKTNIRDPMMLRDPFKKPKSKEPEGYSVIDTGKKYWKKEDGVITNYGRKYDPRKVDVQKINIIGILLGSERRVLAQIGNDKTKILLKEGMKFGPKKELQLKAILPAGIVFVEKIKNVYNQDEYIETIVPVKEREGVK